MMNRYMYHIHPETFAVAKKLGITVKPSVKAHKKLDVYRNGELVASVGDVRYSDFHTYVKEKGMAYALKRRQLYHLRHKNEGVPGELAKALLW
jgi:hypothetical protein